MLDKKTFSAARVLMMVCVFFCHVFRDFNFFGFLFVSVFFFMSGFGNSFSRDRSLVRLVPYILIFFFVDLLYSLTYGQIVLFDYPSSWFLVVYFSVCLLYRFLPFSFLVPGFLLFALFLWILDFHWVWWASFPGFLLGVFVHRYGLFSWSLSLVAILISFVLVFLGCPFWQWGFIPFFVLAVLRLSRLLLFVAPISSISFDFYALHVYFLGLFGCTWCLGGSPGLPGVVCSFVFSLFFAFCLSRIRIFLLNYRR